MESPTPPPHQAHKAHVLVLPYPAQGHINPMLQFSKRLSSKGLRVTFITTVHLSKSNPSISSPTPSPTVHFATISDGYDLGGYSQAESTATYLTTFQAVGSKSLADLITNLNRPNGPPVKAIIYDGFLPWALEVAHGFGLIAAAFFTQACAVNSVYYQVNRGLIRLPVTGSPKIRVPGGAELEMNETPSFVHIYGSYPHWFEVVVGQFGNIDKADWVLCNIFYDMEPGVVDWMATKWRVRAVGPTLPSMYLDKRLPHDTDYGLHLLQPSSAACLSFLSQYPPRAVVYVSFGSAASLTEEQTAELAAGLTATRRPFLWVVREPERPRLPKEFMDEISKPGSMGLVVGWAPQLEILAHESTGCFLTHCGFNSVLEAICLGVPMVALPQWTDQATNAKHVEEVWTTGIRAREDEKGVARREEVERCVREIMDGARGEEIRNSAEKWKELAKKAMDEGGSSDKNIDEFIASL